mmetsp:Transcript_23661/g.52590  ORF Transcript_23661/g.52590 Transcript_23661/m.52590 type:complete len:236 (+) Transcript_23661:455-1162(+)
MRSVATPLTPTENFSSRSSMVRKNSCWLSSASFFRSLSRFSKSSMSDSNFSTCRSSMFINSSHTWSSSSCRPLTIFMQSSWVSEEAGCVILSAQSFLDLLNPSIRRVLSRSSLLRRSRTARSKSDTSVRFFSYFSRDTRMYSSDTFLKPVRNCSICSFTPGMCFSRSTSESSANRSSKIVCAKSTQAASSFFRYTSMADSRAAFSAMTDSFSMMSTSSSWQSFCAFSRKTGSIKA